MLNLTRTSLLLLCSLLLACAVALAQTQGSPTPAPTAGATATPVAIVHTKDFAYDPKELDIHIGDAVTFVNDDEIAHTVTSDDKSFDSGNLDQHQRWTHTFTKPGTYTYTCTYHPFMSAKIVVTAP
jgi:plastocyanin